MIQKERRTGILWHLLKYLPAVKIHINHIVIYNLVAAHTIYIIKENWTVFITLSRLVPTIKHVLVDMQ